MIVHSSQPIRALPYNWLIWPELNGIELLAGGSSWYMSWFTTAQNLSAGSGEQPLPQLHMQSTVNGGLPLLALPFFRVVYVDTDARPVQNGNQSYTFHPPKNRYLGKPYSLGNLPYHSYFSVANKEISSLFSPSGAIKIYSQSLTCSTTGGEFQFFQNNSHMWTSSAFRAQISPITSSVFMQSFLTRTSV